MNVNGCQRHSKCYDDGDDKYDIDDSNIDDDNDNVMFIHMSG